MNATSSSLSIQKNVLISTVLLILIVTLGIGSWFIYTYVQDQKIEDAKKMITTIQAIPNKEEQINKLIEIEEKLPHAVMPSTALTIANYALHNQQSEKALEYYKKVASSPQAIRTIAILGEAQSLIALGTHNKNIGEKNNAYIQAINILTPHIETLPNEMKVIYLFTLAQAQEKAQKISDAIQTYNKIASIDKNSYGYIQYRVQILKSQY